MGGDQLIFLQNEETPKLLCRLKQFPLGIRNLVVGSCVQGGVVYCCPSIPGWQVDALST